LAKALTAWAYPFAWSPETLKLCAIWELLVEDNPVGYVWAHYVMSERVAEIHLTTAPGCHVTRGYVRALFEIFHQLCTLGVRVVIARPTTRPHAHQLRRLGFKDSGVFMFLEL